MVEKDADGVTDLHKLKLGRSIPESCGDAATEAVEGLRAALDHTGFAAAVASGVTAPKRAKFPFGDTAADVENDIRRGCKDLPTEIQALFRAFQPYQGGNNPLWTLNRLCNVNKHQMLIPVGFAAGGMTMRQGVATGPVKVHMPRWDNDKNEIVIASVGPGGDFKYDAEITFFVAFNDIQPIGETPAIPLLRDIVSEVRRVVWDTEAECRRLGLLK